jgi:hypothetical protein
MLIVHCNGTKMKKIIKIMRIYIVKKRFKIEVVERKMFEMLLNFFITLSKNPQNLVIVISGL